MAKSGWSTANLYRGSQSLITTFPITISAWAKTNAVGAAQVIAGIFNSASGLDRNCILLYQRTTGGISTLIGSATANNQSDTGAAVVTAGTWYHACGTATSATSYSSFLNGASKNTNTVSTSPTGINRVSIGLEDASTGGAPFNGSIAEVGIWNVVLADAEIDLLAKGIKPTQLRPDKLIFYFPLISDNVTVVGNNAPVSLVGSLSTADHCKILGGA